MNVKIALFFFLAVYFFKKLDNNDDDHHHQIGFFFVRIYARHICAVDDDGIRFHNSGKIIWSMQH